MQSSSLFQIWETSILIEMSLIGSKHWTIDAANSQCSSIPNALYLSLFLSETKNKSGKNGQFRKTNSEYLVILL
jgi:hypothetical protein